jgi:histidine triad (HIT) family protein
VGLCRFCEIIAGQRSADIVLDEEHAVAFLDGRPLFPGHTLLVTRQHIESLDELPDHLLEPLFAAARRLSIAVRTAVDAHGTFVAINNKVSQSVPHLHIHVVPRRQRDGLRGFFWPRHNYEDERHRAQTADAIRRALEDARPARDTGPAKRRAGSCRLRCG